MDVKTASTIGGVQCDRSNRLFAIHQIIHMISGVIIDDRELPLVEPINAFDRPINTQPAIVQLSCVEAHLLNDSIVAEVLLIDGGGSAFGIDCRDNAGE